MSFWLPIHHHPIAQVPPETVPNPETFPMVVPRRWQEQLKDLRQGRQILSPMLGPKAASGTEPWSAASRSVRETGSTRPSGGTTGPQ